MENSELLERFLPGYRIVCRIFARYLGIDLTDFMSKAFVLFALLKSAQYLWASLAGISTGFLTSSIEVPEGDVQRDVLKWVERRFRHRGGRMEVVSSDLSSAGTSAPSREEGKVQEDHPPPPSITRITYAPAFDSTMYILRNYHVITLRRQRGKSASGDTILLTCIGLTTQPLRNFLDECVESTAGVSRGIVSGGRRSLSTCEATNRDHEHEMTPSSEKPHTGQVRT